jgi:hypothetical protein
LPFFDFRIPYPVGMKITGVVNRFKLFLGAALVAGFLIGPGTSAAHAGQIDLAGVSVSWDDANLGAAPNGTGCRQFLFPWNNSGPQSPSSIRVILTSASGIRVEESRLSGSSGIRPGEYGNFVIDAFIRDGFLPGTQVVVQMSSSNAQYVRSESAVKTFTLGASPTQKMVEVTKVPCTPENRENFSAKLCKNGNVLALKEPYFWISGTDNESFSLFNRKGPVPLDNTFGFELNPFPNVERGTEFFRLDGTKFKPGKYLVIATGGLQNRGNVKSLG